MRTWRVGTLSMGATLLLMGIGLLYAQINEQLVLDWAIHWWPLIFIFLGAEVLWQAYQAKKTDGRVVYDILSVIIIGLLLCFGLAMQALSETGVIEQCKTMLISENYELQETLPAIPLEEGIKEVIIEDSNHTLEIFSRPTNTITASVKANVTAPTRNDAMKLLHESKLETRREGDTLYITFTAISPASHMSERMSNQTYELCLPGQLKVSLYSDTSEVNIHAKNIANDWYIKGVQSAALDLPSSSNLKLVAQVNSRSELQGNAQWTIKETAPDSASDSQNDEEPTRAEGSLNLGAGQHRITINSNGSVSVDILP